MATYRFRCRPAACSPRCRADRRPIAAARDGRSAAQSLDLRACRHLGRTAAVRADRHFRGDLRPATHRAMSPRPAPCRTPSTSTACSSSWPTTPGRSRRPAPSRRRRTVSPWPRPWPRGSRGRGQPDGDRPGWPELHRDHGRGSWRRRPRPAAPPEIYLVVGADLVPTWGHGSGWTTCSRWSPWPSCPAARRPPARSGCRRIDPPRSPPRLAGRVGRRPPGGCVQLGRPGRARAGGSVDDWSRPR